jgi:hypothetical protein
MPNTLPPARDAVSAASAPKGGGELWPLVQRSQVLGRRLEARRWRLCQLFGRHRGWAQMFPALSGGAHDTFVAGGVGASWFTSNKAAPPDLDQGYVIWIGTILARGSPHRLSRSPAARKWPVQTPC